MGVTGAKYFTLYHTAKKKDYEHLTHIKNLT